MKKLTHKEFLKKLNEKNKYFKKGDFEIIGYYVNNRTKILIKNKYGECLVSPASLLNGSPPSIETSTNKNNYFINMAKEVQGDKYNYSKINYTKSNIKVKIICPSHGEFLQEPHCHLLGQGCKECKRYSRLDGRRLKNEDFVKKANKIHKNKYTYEKSKVNGNKNKVIITCPIHGNYEQSPNSHLKGSGCKKCYLENNGYNKGKFIYFAKDRVCKLYLIEVYNKKEKFLKAGITSKSIKERFSNSRKLPYDYKILYKVECKNASQIWEKEVELKKLFKKYKYKPLINFKGYTECFELREKENIINYLKNFKNGI